MAKVLLLSCLPFLLHGIAIPTKGEANRGVVSKFHSGPPLPQEIIDESAQPKLPLEDATLDLPDTTFTYTIDRYPTNPDTNLTDEEIDAIIRGAFDLWSSVTALTFLRVPPSHSPVHIHLSWEQGLHHRGHEDPTDWDAFNLAPLHWAHAGGRLEWVVRGWVDSASIHFNDEQRNMSNPDHQMAGSKGAWAARMVYCLECWVWPWQEVEILAADLQLVALHEIGHVLGLPHSNSISSVMYPKVLWDTPHIDALGEEDIRAVQELHGEPHQRGP